MNHYELHGSLPPTEEHKWRKNLTVHVLAESASKALELVLAKHPGYRVATLSLRGGVDIIQQVTQ